ncbi:LamG-like jellyroll fold domain-containing protein [Streptomyces sp. ISL-94]|uniref:LamG-like jellyroll fold domain-containing protein n=1 Tax=Streptomyces sp. ISL-94 TaxID=2819190 RepID=UPI001BE7CEAD|nr:LamG-like jellyroll fold domain-containing protein [Streptomyces sp. ISL-94]MBT2479442.1 ricin-type beta-trefoil lectin domain protein [Streptomyces sp. ISL-94]
MRPASRPVAAAGLVALALSITSVGVAPSATAVDKPSAPTAQTPPERPTTERERAEDAALAEAKRTGKSVPVQVATTETDTVVANPDGTLGLTRSVAPLRTKPDGNWVDLDATLVKAADGALRPKATVSGLTLSGGGTAPLATLDQDGKQLVLTWPEPLPLPVLEGDSALYREVIPGIDLKVTADVSGGISQILVVKSAEAAKHPKLTKLTMGLKGEGVSVSADGNGNLKAADGSGRTVFQAPTPTMWDSTAPVQAPLAKSSGTSFSKTALTQSGTDGEAARSASDSTGPADSAKVTRLQADLGKDSLALTPDKAFLTDPATAYPVFIDPAWQPTNRGTQHWAWVQEAYPTTVSYDDYGDTYDPGVGYQRWRTRTGLERYYVQLDTSDLRDKAIKKASFFATQSYAADAGCGNTYNVDLHSTEPLLSDITWNTQPRDWEVLRTTSLNSAGGPGCPGSTTRGEWDVRDHLAANEWRGSITYALFASNESKSSSNTSFKRFTRDKNNLPFLYIEYNRAPYDPWELGTFPVPQNPNGNGCGWVGATNYAGLSIGAWIGDPDGQPNDAIFDVVDTASGAVAYSSGWIGAASGTHWVSAHPTNLTDGHAYLWRVRGGDGDMMSVNSSTGCTFTMDTQPPSVPVVTSAEYPPSGTLPGSTKYIGQPGTFTVKAADPLSGVLHYEWAFNSTIPVGGANRVDPTADGSAAIPLTPTTWGTNILRVQAVDRAGNRSQQQTYAFYVPDNPNAKTTLGDITGDERVDFIAPADNGDLVVYPTAVDPAAGGVIASNVANSPGGKGWGAGTLTTHRGGNGIRIDDLWVHRDGQLKLYRNSLTQGGLAANGGLYYNAGKAVAVQRPYAEDCKVAATGQPCGTEYAEDWTRVKQMLAVGDALPETGVTPRNDLLTVENDGTNSSLVLLQGTGTTGELRDPVVLVLSRSGWDNLTLIAPGDATGDGLPDLWARDKTTGDLYQYANVAGNPAALGDHTKRTKIGSGLQAATHPVVGSSGDTNADGLPDLWALDSLHRLRTWDGVATAGKVTGFQAAHTMGDARISTSQWKLNEGTGTTAADLRGRSNATLSATGAIWSDATVAGTATRVVSLDGTTGTVTAAGPGVDTSRSFTVSTWAKSDKPSSIVLSQDGQHASGFILWHDQDGTWRFGMSKKDDDNWDYDQTIVMNDAAKARISVWTQLTATYDDKTGMIALYVNGTLAGTGHHAKANAWNATGPLVLGRYKNQSKPDPASYLKGSISNPAVYNHSTVPSATRTTLVSAVSSNKCVDDYPASNEEGKLIQIWDCDVNGTTQRFEIGENGELRAAGKCVSTGGGTQNRTLLQISTCNGTGAQQWLPTAASGFYNPQSGRCIDLPNARLDNGTRLELQDCNQSNAQRWLASGLASPLGTTG